MINYNVIQQQKVNKEKLLKNKTDKNLNEKINKLFLSDNFEEVKNVVENELFFECFTSIFSSKKFKGIQ